MLPSELLAVFDEHVPEGFQRETFQLLTSTYSRTFREVSDRFEFPEFNSVWGHERRAAFDRDWRSLAKQFAPDVIGETATNSTGTHHFTTIRAGRFLITASAVDEKFQTVRDAGFRNSYSLNNQKLMWPLDDADKSDDVYCILIHAPGKGSERSSLRVAKIVFPFRNGSAHPLKIDLYERFEYVVIDTPIEEIEDNARPHLKKPRNNEGAAGA